jgi:soluble P-type ATPase
MIDPPRPEVPDALERCRSAGIRVIMLTGDFGLTAKTIAQQIGMMSARGRVVHGDEMSGMDDAALAAVLRDEPEIIFARIAPAQKLRVVQVLQSLGQIVTVTGDGVNDAPALKNADMGVAMGVGGTEVAKEASDMVLMDDNFATIVSAVEEGRTIFDNIKKFIAYILTSNVPEILPFIAFVLLDIPLPLTVILILTIDLGTDIVPALGLGAEKPETDVMKRKPRPRNERLLSRNLLFMSYGIVGVIQAAAGFFTYFTSSTAAAGNVGTGAGERRSALPHRDHRILRLDHHLPDRRRDHLPDPDAEPLHRGRLLEPPCPGRHRHRASAARRDLLHSCLQYLFRNRAARALAARAVGALRACDLPRGRAAPGLRAPRQSLRSALADLVATAGSYPRPRRSARNDRIVSVTILKTGENLTGSRPIRLASPGVTVCSSAWGSCHARCISISGSNPPRLRRGCDLRRG